jgi:hypothetical protein
MIRRRDFTPALTGESSVWREVMLEHLRRWESDTLETIESLRSHRQRVEASANQLENPQAAIQYIDFFINRFVRFAADFDRVCEEWEQGSRRAVAGSFRQIATSAAAEEHRCIVFRDKWINKPLPYEALRPMLDRICTEVRDQLVDYRDLDRAAVRVETLAGSEGPKGPGSGQQPGEDREGFDRRALFSRLFGRDPRASEGDR